MVRIGNTYQKMSLVNQAARFWRALVRKVPLQPGFGGLHAHQPTPGHTSPPRRIPFGRGAFEGPRTGGRGVASRARVLTARALLKGSNVAGYLAS